METIHAYHHHPFNRKEKRMKRIIFGSLVLIAGGLLLAFNLELLPKDYMSVVFSWQSLLIALGLVNVFEKESRIIGFILMAVGGFFITPLVLNVRHDFANVMWPALLIVVGILIISKKRSRFHKRRSHRYKIDENATLEEGYLNEENVFGGSKRIVTSPIFKGGNIKNVFGGAEIDLRNTKLGEGDNVLNLECVFGGVSLKVPSDWNVQIEMSAVLGGFSDKRTIIKKEEKPESKLIITGNAVFGGGEIKS